MPINYNILLPYIGTEPGTWLFSITIDNPGTVPQGSTRYCLHLCVPRMWRVHMAYVRTIACHVYASLRITCTHNFLPHVRTIAFHMYAPLCATFTHQSVPYIRTIACKMYAPLRTTCVHHRDTCACRPCAPSVSWSNCQLNVTTLVSGQWLSISHASESLEFLCSS